MVMGRDGTSLGWHPLTPDRWDDLERLFGPKGPVGGCWCMLWRRRRSEFDASKGDGNRCALKALVDDGEVPGILLYRDGEPVGWCSVAPRASFPALARSRILKPVDETPVWSISCLFIPRRLRGAGLADALIEAACAHAAASGAAAVEAYPVEPKNDAMPAVFAWTGFHASFERAGFVEVARRSPTRPIMRRAVGRRDC
jgi:GNAT superfamily N-acetyltransferase